MNAQTITKEYLGSYFNLAGDDLDKAYSSLERIVFESGEDVVHAGDAADGIYFIDDGKIDVLDAEGQPVNAIEEGQCFGEYGVIASEPRMSTCRAKGRVVVFRMSGEDFLALIGKNPRIVGNMIKQVYKQVSSKHSQLLAVARKSKGILSLPEKKNTNTLRDLVLPYAAIIIIFVLTAVFAPQPQNLNGFWLLLPIVFLVCSTLVTKRTMESLFLTVFLCAGITGSGHYIKGMAETLVGGLSSYDNAATFFIMALIGAVTSLLAAAGGISALKRPAREKIKTGRGALLAMIGILIFVFVDDYLNLLAASFCIIGITDKHRIPREIPAFIGTSATSICSLNPLSVWGAYLIGTIAASTGGNAGSLFMHSFYFNFASILALAAVVLAALGFYPRVGKFKEAEERVANGGKLWPEGSEKYFMEDYSSEIYGKPVNLILPIICFAGVTLIARTVYAGENFSVAPSCGLIASIILMFGLYVGQKVTTPAKFLQSAMDGVESTVQPIVLLLLTCCLSSLLEQMGCMVYLEGIINDSIGGSLWLLPVFLYVVFTLFTLLLGSSWGMYGIGMPIAIHLAGAFGINMHLCIGVIMAAGVTGDNLCPYLSESSLLSSAVGCEPKTSRSIRISYWSVIFAVCLALYAVLGYLLN